MRTRTRFPSTSTAATLKTTWTGSERPGAVPHVHAGRGPSHGSLHAAGRAGGSNATDAAVTGEQPRTETCGAARDFGMAAVSSSVERAFGTDFSGVRIYSESRRAADLGALAFTQGNEIHVAPGHWAPETTRGRTLIAHELSHVLQQRAGRVRPTRRIGGVELNDEPALEAEADAVTMRVNHLNGAGRGLLRAARGVAASSAPCTALHTIQRREHPNGTSASALGPGDWLASDREDNTVRWRTANLHNLKAADSSQYRQIVERRDFYRWFYEYTASVGFATRWALAAYIVANGAYELSTMPQLEWLATQAGAVNNELQGIMREGNQVIFDDVLPKLRMLVQGGLLTGQAALQWDMNVLSEEQALIQPLYQRMSPATLRMLESAARQRWLARIGAFRPFSANANEVVAGRYNRGGMVLEFSGANLRSVDDRWQYGMQLGNTFTPGGTGYTPSAARPAPRAEYTNGAALSRVDTRPHLHMIDAQMDGSSTVSAAEVQRLLGELTLAEQRELMRSDRPGTWNYMQPLINLLGWDGYKAAVLRFRVDLVEQMRWLEAGAGDRALHWRLFDYDEVRPMILGFPAAERARLHTSAWREVFIWICTDRTISQAVRDLGLDPATARAWIEEETDLF